MRIFEMTRSLSGIAIVAAFGALMLLGAPAPLAAQEFRHGLSTFGDLKYPADFKHFDYVNPAAPIGGRFSTYGGPLNSFDTFNPFILKGDPATGLGLLFDTLMVRSGDEPDAVYGLVAKDAAVAPDRNSVTFRLRPEAKYSDGSAITADDVVFTFDALKTKGQPGYRIMMRDVTKAEALDAHTVRFSFTGELTRDLPIVVAGLPVLSKAYYATREFDQTTLDAPLGSGPNLIGDFRPGAQITYKRRDDYWAKDLPVNVGTNNFDEIRYEYYRDRTAALEGFKAGTYDFREEFTARDWTTGYDVAAVRDGRIQRIVLPDANPSGAQGFFFNTRRAKFADVRVRRALDYAFDYEFTNKNLFYGLYKRTNSYFENSDMKATGKPTPAELALLEPFRSKLLPAVFEEPYTSPVSDGSGTDRKLLREAARLLDEAGCKAKDRVRTCPSGDVLDIEFLIYEGTFERVLAPYVKNLQAIGVGATIRRVDSAQYQRRMKSFDFDVVTSRFVMRLTPGIEMRNYWGSENADVEGSVNLAGIKDPVIDALLDKVVDAKSREELVAATRAIDRVLRAGHYWVPQWYKASHHIAYWDKFSRPPVKPKYARGAPDTWWYDAAKAAKLNPN
jgi:microcin C transport system substrate-binding protein